MNLVSPRDIPMSDRNPTKLRNEKGNHFCMNCQQRVFTKTPFNKFHLSIFIAISGILVLLVGSVGEIFTRPSASIVGSILISAPIGTLTYVIYWYAIRKPVCPMCKARHFRSLTNRQQTDGPQNHPTNQQQKSEQARN